MARKAKTKTTPPPPEEPTTRNDLLTRAQAETLKAWWRLYEQNGKEPTIRELTHELGERDTGAGRKLIVLEQKGYITRKMILAPGPREITPLGKRWLKVL
jgi:DNA-binding MarR family transcriptional regulator